MLDLLPQHLRRQALFPVGRLDKDTEGLLLLTNDGPLAHALLAPGRHVDKVYYGGGRSAGPAGPAAFQAGVTLADGTVCQPADLTVLDPPSQGLVTLREGKYHQVKRMLAARGKPVTYLKRLSMGPLTLDPAPSGRGLAAVDPGRKKPVLDDKRNYFGIFHKDSRKAIEIARRNRYNIGYSMMPSWGILIFVRRNQEKPL